MPTARSKKPPVRPKYYLFHNNSRSFNEIRDGFVVGRTEGDLLYVDDPLLSAKQCRFQITGNEIFVEDLGATNRTCVNTVPIRSGMKRRILLNDVIELGGQRMVLTTQDRFNPSNTEDLTRRAQSQFRAIRKDDGSLTRTFTGMLVDKTLLVISRAQHRQLRINGALKPWRSRSVQVVGVQPHASRVRKRRPRHTGLVVFFLFVGIAMLAWLAPWAHA